MTQKLRTQNLNLLFGEVIMGTSFIYLPCGADKDEVLDKYKGTECWWIEDKPENAEVGKKCRVKLLIDCS